MKIAAAFLSGLLFSVGLVISGMTKPANVIGFLDFFGEWKPGLMFVMAGALGAYAALYPLVMKRRAPLFDIKFDIPKTKKWDAKLIVGSAAFGIGWGMGGFCPGPALVALGSGAAAAAVFLASFATGVLLFRLTGSGDQSASENNQDACG